MPEKIVVSILIRAKNEERTIGKVLDALSSQTYKNFETLIVDSGSTDKTLEIVKKYPVKIYEIKPEDFTFGYSLNFGFQKAEGEFVFCLSAHALPLSKDWLMTIVSNFEDDKVAAVMCRILPWPDCNPFDRRGLLRKFNIQKQELVEGPPFIFGNISSAIRKSAWKKVHFDETLSYCEDHDWMRKIRKLGYKVIYEPEAKVYHSHNETLKQIYRRSYRESYALNVLKFKNYSLPHIIFDLVAGSIYDMGYVVLKKDDLKWFFFAPLRRLVINYAGHKASRMAKSRGVASTIEKCPNSH